MAPPILKMEMKMGGLRIGGKKKVRQTNKKGYTTIKEDSPCNGKGDQQRDQLYKTQTN